MNNLSLVIAKAPHPPQITLSNNEQLEAGNEIEAECQSTDGRPAANITWYLNDQPLGSGTSEVVDSSAEGTTYYTVYSRLHYRLKPEDHTKNLICRAIHPGYPEGFADTRTQLNVNYRPVPMNEQIISGLEIGSSASIGPITIQANPRPTLKWTVDGTVINQGEQTQRFVANEPVQVGVGAWNCSLTIIELTLQDTTRTYRLRANNAFGTTDYSIRIGGSSDAAGKFFLHALLSELDLIENYSFNRNRTRNCADHRDFHHRSFCPCDCSIDCGREGDQAMVLRR